MKSLIIAILFAAGTATATTTFVGASRMSELVLADGEDSNNPTFYAGIAGECSDKDDESTCDSCAEVPSTSVDNLTPCNKRRIHESLELQITVRSDNTSVEGGDLVLKVGDEDDDGTEIWREENISANTDTTLTVDWQDVCAALNTGGSSDCDENIEADMSIGFTEDGSDDFIETGINIDVVIQGMDSTDDQVNHADCFSLDDPSSYTGGFCQFEVSPGDEKAIVESLNTEQTVRTPKNGTEHMQAIRFFCKEVSESLCDGGSSGATLVSELANISLTDNDCLRQEYSVSDEDVVFSDSIQITQSDSDGSTMENNKCYGFVMATEDLAGNIGYFSDSAFLETNYNAGYSLTTQPSKVTGLLDEDDNCALIYVWGDDSPIPPMARIIRDHFLTPSWWGSLIVAAYYQSSPTVVRLMKPYHSWLPQLRTAFFLLWFLAFSFVLVQLSRSRRSSV